MTNTGRIAPSGAHQSSKALVGAAVIHLVPGVLYWSIYGFNSGINDWIYAGGSALFLIMAIWARWSPLIPSLLSAVLYINLLCLQLRNIAKWNVITWIIQATILGLIGIAVFSAFKQSRREPSAPS